MPPILRPTRQLGKTGVAVPLIGYGTAPLGKPKVPRDKGAHLLNYAIDQGITYLDTSPDYHSEPVVGDVMRHRRAEVFLATKVNMRRDHDVLESLKESLRQLQTDHVDLIQVHAVNAWADLEMALAADGTVQALEKARDQGLTRFIGITGHARPAILANALMRYPFDTVLCALGAVDHLVSAPDTFLLPIARERNVGVIAMKVLAHGHTPNPETALRYSLGLPGVAVAIIGMDSQDQIDENVRAAASFAPLSQAEEQALLDDLKKVVEKDAKDSKKGESDLFWLHDTNVMGWQEQNEPALVQY